MKTSSFPLRAARLPACALGIMLVGSVSACANSEITGPIPGVNGVTTLNAAQTRQYFNLEQGVPVSIEGSPQTSGVWDLGFLTTSVILNGGAAGPAGVLGYCVCQNSGATTAQILAMTPESELPEYEAITLSDVPAAAAFTAEVFTEEPWYRYNLALDNRISPMFHVYLIKRGEAYYKLQITGYYSITNAPRHITFRYQRLVR